MAHFHSNALIGAGGQGGAEVEIERSLRFNSGDSSSLTRTPSSASNRKTWTWSGWIKKSKFGENVRVFQARSGTSGNQTFIQFRTDDKIYVGGNSDVFLVNTDAVFRDPGSWGHLCVSFDTTQSTASERIRIFWNGVQQDVSGTQPSQDYATAQINTTLPHAIGGEANSSSEYFNGYLADIYLIDGSALDCTSFGEFDDNGVWQAAAYSGAYGTNGFHLLDFANESTIGHDSSGNNNDFTAYNFLAATGKYLDDFTGTQRSGFEWAFAFDGDRDHGSLPNAGSSWTFTPSTSIPFTTLAIYAYKDSSPGTLRINGTDVSSQVPNHNGIGPNQRTVITGLTSPLTSIQNISNGSLANVVFAALEIDGAILHDRRAEVDILRDVPINDTETTDTCAGGLLSGNYATLNPLQSGLDLSNGNLGFAIGTRSDWKVAAATMHIDSGRWYWEITNGRQYTAGGNIIYGLRASNASSPLVTTGGTTAELGYNDGNKGYMSSALKRDGGSGTTSYGSTFGTNDVIGVAFDADAGTLMFYKNGVNQGVAFTGLTGSWAPAVALYTGGTQVSPWEFYINFGALPFRYPIIHSRLVSGPVAGSPYDATKMFDGSTSTYTDHSSTNSTITYSNTLTGVTSLRVYIHQGNSTGTVTTVGANGTQTDTISANFGPGYHTISLSSTGSTIHSIAFTRGGSGNFLSIYAIEVNGVILLDSAATGFKTLNTSSLPTPTIADGSDYFDTKIYTGNGSAQTISGFSFSPDFAWFKNRATTKDPRVTDIIRGTGVELYTSSTSGDYSQAQGVTAFNSDGVSVGSDGGYNGSGNGMVLWAWDAGSSTASNTNGSITSSVRANQSAGFSIVSYTGNGTAGATIGHGLSAAPEMVWYKNRDRVENWGIYSKEVGASKSLYFPSTTAALTANSGSANMYNSTDPSATVLTVGQAAHVNGNGEDIIAYCFAPVAGYSAIGSFEGNGSADGPFVYTGFRVAFLLFRNADSSQNTFIYDTSRDSENPNKQLLRPNLNNIEGTISDGIDFLSNGFKMRQSSTSHNGSGNTIIYAAFAENPFQANGGLAR